MCVRIVEGIKKQQAKKENIHLLIEDNEIISNIILTRNQSLDPPLQEQHDATFTSPDEHVSGNTQFIGKHFDFVEQRSEEEDIFPLDL